MHRTRCWRLKMVGVHPLLQVAAGAPWRQQDHPTTVVEPRLQVGGSRVIWRRAVALWPVGPVQRQVTQHAIEERHRRMPQALLHSLHCHSLPVDCLLPAAASLSCTTPHGRASSTCSRCAAAACAASCAGGGIAATAGLLLAPPPARRATPALQQGAPSVLPLPIACNPGFSEINSEFVKHMRN